MLMTTRPICRRAAWPVLLQYVERELARVPPQVARRHSKQLWSLVYIPQVSANMPM